MSRTAVAFVRPSTSPSSPPAALEIIATIEAEAVGLALDRLAAHQAQALFLVRLGDAAGSLRELVGLLDWLAIAKADLIAADVAFDSGTAEGARTVGLLREIDGWGRHQSGDRRPRGRPGLGASSPALAHRIGALRDRGLSLQAIATQLNDHGVPTPRGGALWRPSSVQAALGYRRPRPPVPGAPPIPPKQHPAPPGKPGAAPPAPAKLRANPHRRPPRP